MASTAKLRRIGKSPRMQRGVFIGTKCRSCCGVVEGQALLVRIVCRGVLGGCDRLGGPDSAAEGGKASHSVAPRRAAPASKRQIGAAAKRMAQSNTRLGVALKPIAAALGAAAPKIRTGNVRGRTSSGS